MKSYFNNSHYNYFVLRHFECNFYRVFPASFLEKYNTYQKINIADIIILYLLFMKEEFEYELLCKTGIFYMTFIDTIFLLISFYFVNICVTDK